jgi:2-keto-4-pentenoate hydratase/2-oxohepta-3-ene-1,7-dioic acid hydratase in catechol pathway
MLMPKFLINAPTKIIAIGLNYCDHAKELCMDIPNNPIIFLKPTSSLIGPEETIILPSFSKKVDYEAELALVIKEKCKDVNTKEAMQYVEGFMCLNDVTARDLQKLDGQWTRAKSYDTFCPVGPRLVKNLNANNLDIKCILNGKIVQSSNTKNFIFKIEEIISFISKIMTLNPGDIITTGTPSGVGQLKSGDVVEIEIEGIGKLRNPVK